MEYSVRPLSTARRLVSTVWKPIKPIHLPNAAGWHVFKNSESEFGVGSRKCESEIAFMTARIKKHVSHGNGYEFRGTSSSDKKEESLPSARRRHQSHQFKRLIRTVQCMCLCMWTWGYRGSGKLQLWPIFTIGCA